MSGSGSGLALINVDVGSEVDNKNKQVGLMVDNRKRIISCNHGETSISATAEIAIRVIAWDWQQRHADIEDIRGNSEIETSILRTKIVVNTEQASGIHRVNEHRALSI